MACQLFADLHNCDPGIGCGYEDGLAHSLADGACLAALPNNPIRASWAAFFPTESVLSFLS